MKFLDNPYDCLRDKWININFAGDKINDIMDPFYIIHEQCYLFAAANGHPNGGTWEKL